MRHSDVLLDDFDEERQRSVGTGKEKRNKCFESSVVAVIVLGVIAAAGLFAWFVYLPSTHTILEDGTSSNPSPFLKSPHLCDTCHMNPEVDGDYVLCSSCGFEASNDKTLKCPKGYGNMFVTKAHVGPQQSALVEGKIYTHCKEQMTNGGSACDLNLAELIPDLDTVVPPPRPQPRDGKRDWMRHKREWGMPPSPFGFEAWDIFPFDDLPMGPNGESMIDEAMEEDQAIIEALEDEPEITGLQHLFLALPHQPSLKLEKALMKCMEVGNKGVKHEPQCADSTQTVLKCHGADAANTYCIDKIANKVRGPICSDGTAADCPAGSEPYKKGARCMPESGEGAPVKPMCDDGKEAKRCKKKGIVRDECLNAKGKRKHRMKMFCKDGSNPTCPAGYVDKRDMPKCIADNGDGTNAAEVCTDGTEPQPCKVAEVLNDLCADPSTGKKIKHMRKVCGDGSKPECPAGFSKGPCLAKEVDENGDRDRTSVECADPTDKVIHCHRKKFQTKYPTLCGADKKPMCLNAAVEAQCPSGYSFETENKIFLSKSRPRGPDCNGGGGRHGSVGEESYLLPRGPHGESLLEHATPDDQPILDALMESPEISDLDQLYDAIPAEHPMSFKLSKALIKCMNPEDMMDVVQLDCGDAELLKGCKKVQEGDANYEACQKKKEYKKMGEKLPFCTDMTVAKCPTGYESYSKNPPCVSASDPTAEREKMVCEDGTPATDCKKNRNSGKSACLLGVRKRFVCPDGKKGTCPTGYSRGECVNQETGERKKAKCSHEKGNKDKPIKCFKPENEGHTLCAETTGPMCESTEAPPTCPENYEFDFTPYQKNIEDNTTPEALVLKAGRPHGPGPRGPPRRPPFGKGPKGEISVDFLCLKVDLN